MLEDDLNNFIKLMSSSKEKKMVMKKVGKNTNEKERILFYATAGTNLNDYAVYDTTYDENGNISNKLRHFYRFPANEIMKEDGYVCLFVDNSNSFATMNGQRIKTFHMNLENETIFNKDLDKVYLIKIAETQKKSVEEDK